jgi:hypothetical protein
LHKVTKSSQYPQFWNEEWLQAAIHEVDKKAMTQEQRLAYEMTISANALAIKNENKKIQKARELENMTVKSNAVKKALLNGKLSISEIADYNDVSTDFVLDIQMQFTKKQ